MSKATIHYYDIGDYLSREEKLSIVNKFGSVNHIPWQTLQSNEHGDWLSLRNDVFGTFISMGDRDNKNSIFQSGLFCRGLESARDAWIYNSNRTILKSNVQKSIVFFNEQAELFSKEKLINTQVLAKDHVSYDDSSISWSRAFLTDIENGKKKIFESKRITTGIYRPFFKQNLYFSREQNNVVSRMDSFFPTPETKNLVICVPGVGITKDFSTIITDTLPDLELIGKSQCFPLYYYEERQKQSPTLFDAGGEEEYIRRDGVSDFILERARKQYAAKNITKEDIFYYVYGFLHSSEYRIQFANDLKKMLPRLPLVEDVRDFWAFSKAGRALAELHINYEKVPPYTGVTVTGAELLSFIDTEPADTKLYLVEKMRFPKKGQKDTIIYNSRITIENIPAKAYEYVVNGKSAIEWIMERYQITTHKESGIRNDPNDWATEVGNPRYILDLLLSIINVSVQTVEIVEGLPELSFFEGDKDEE